MKALEINFYHQLNILYWQIYKEEINFDMINAVKKHAGFANDNWTNDLKKLYLIYMKDGKKIYTDLAGYRKILKAAREKGVEINVL